MRKAISGISSVVAALILLGTSSAKPPVDEIPFPGEFRKWFV